MSISNIYNKAKFHVLSISGSWDIKHFVVWSAKYTGIKLPSWELHTVRARSESNIWVDQKYSKIFVQLPPFSLSLQIVLFVKFNFTHQLRVFGQYFIHSDAYRAASSLLCISFFLCYLLFHCYIHDYWYMSADNSEIQLQFTSGSLFQIWFASYPP